MKKIFSIALLIGAANLFGTPMAQAQVNPANATTQGGEFTCSYGSDGVWRCSVTVRF